jgi:hypothetical protein
VKEISLERCNGNFRWRMSLVHAIESASPPPAPPDPSVFTPVIHLEMDSATLLPEAALMASSLCRPRLLCRMSVGGNNVRRYWRIPSSCHSRSQHFSLSRQLSFLASRHAEHVG